MATKLIEINKQNQGKDLSLKRHHDLLKSSASVSDTVISATAALIRYMEGHTTKTQIVNQLTEIGTPDIVEVVDALNDLHATLKTHQNTDLGELTTVMKSILSEAQKIPKEHAEKDEQKFVDYTKQFTALSDAIKAVEKVVKAQELVVHPPVVNVPETKIKVDAPDLKPLQQGFKDVVKALTKIVIPEYKTDNTAVEKLIKDSNKLLKGILEKPISAGGGGGGRATPYSDANAQPYFVTVNKDGSIPANTKDLATRIDSAADPILYVGKAPIGTATSAAAWQISKLDTSSGLIKTWADGDADFNNIYDNRASLSYS